MAFDTAISYLNDYRSSRILALNNEQRMRWFTSGGEAKTLAALFDDTFSSTEENTKWEKLYNDGDDVVKLQGARLEIAFLAGCRRDLRILFASWDDHRVRLPLDQDRYELMRLHFYRLKTDLLNRALKAKADGLKATTQDAETAGGEAN